MAIKVNEPIKSIKLTNIRDYVLLLTGALLQALALRLFLAPANLASGGVSGIAQMINHYTGLPIGVMILLGNLPLFIIGWRTLGGWRFLARTIVAVAAAAIFIDLPLPFLPGSGVTDDPALNSLYGGLVSGVGFGLVYRGQGTSGGTDILVRLLSRRWAMPVSQSYLLTDAAIMFAAGLVFSWENALWAVVMLYVSGLAAQAVTEGESVVRTALIITNAPEAVAAQILSEMERGVTMVNAVGAYTGAQRSVLYCVIHRAEVAQIKRLVYDADPQAFMVIGHASEALGEGFQPFGAAPR